MRADRQERGSGGSAEYEAIICTPLHYAIVREDVPLVETLLASGANIGITIRISSENQCIVLYLSCLYCAESGSRISLKSSREVLREWEERKLEPVLFNIGDKIERSRLRGLSVDMTALGWAVAVPPNMDIIKLLLKHHGKTSIVILSCFVY